MGRIKRGDGEDGEPVGAHHAGPDARQVSRKSARIFWFRSAQTSFFRNATILQIANIAKQVLRSSDPASDQSEWQRSPNDLCHISLSACGTSQIFDSIDGQNLK